MNSRSRRDVPLNDVESLILAQAVWEHGAHAWPTVAKILSKHPLISRPKSFFTAQSSHAMYENIMKEAGFERTEESNAIHSTVNHKLAEKFYIARLEELRDLIVVEETKFTSILSEIEAIRSGNLDAEITARITGIPIVPTEPPQEAKVLEAISSSDEIFGGSELSGMTATPVSPSRSQENPPGAPSEAPVPEAQGETPPGIEDTVGTPTTADDRLSQLLGTLSPIIVEMDEKTQASGKREVQERVTTKEQPQVVVHDMTAPLPPLLSPDIEPATLQGEDRTMLIDDQEKERGEVGDEEAEVEREVEVVEGLVLEEKDELAEEREGEGEVAFRDDLFAETLGKEVDVTETRHDTAEQTAVVDVPAMHEAHLGSPALLEAEVEAAVDDGESSGEEPLHVSRRSTRRRRSTLSPVQPLQTRGKTRRQRAESPPIKTKEEPEADGMEEADSVQQETPSVDFDQDTSPTPEIITRRREGKRKASFVEGVESLRERKRVRDDSEPADDDEAGASSHALRGRRPGTRSDAFKRFQNVIGMLHSQISQHRNGNIFHNPIKNSEAPDYHEIVKRPMDLKTIKMKVKDGSIANSLEYQKEIFLMFANALMYNRPGSDVHTMAEDMMIESEGHIHAFRQTEGLVRGAHRT